MILVTTSFLILAVIALRSSDRQGAFRLDQELSLPSEYRPGKILFVPGGERLILAPKQSLDPALIFDRVLSWQSKPISTEMITWALAASPDGKRLATVSSGPALKIIDLSTGLIDHTFPGEANDSRGTVAWSPDSRWIAYTNIKNTVFVGDVATGQLLKTVALAGAGWVESLAVRPDGTMLVAGGWDRLVVLCTSTWNILKSFKLAETAGIEREGVLSVRFSRDGSLLAAGGGYGYSRLDGSKPVTHGTIKMWTVSDWTLYRHIDLPKMADSLSFSPDGKLLAFSWWGGVSVWDLAAQKELWSETLRSVGMNPSVCFSDQGLLAAVDYRGPIRLWKRVQ